MTFQIYLKIECIRIQLFQSEFGDVVQVVYADE